MGVIGASQASDRDYRDAYLLGKHLARLGVQVICGGLTGVMEAVARGVHEEGGICIGVVPGYNRREANPFISVAIATGMGHARNIIIVSTADVIVAIGGEYGTLSEIAYALKMGKPVAALHSWNIPGIVRVSSVEEALSFVREVLGC